MRVIIIDDETFCIGILETLLQELSDDIEILGTATSVQKGIALINEVKPELVFLDINLKGGDAFMLLEKVAFNDFKIIFTTAHNNYAIKALEFATVSYLLKPIDEELLEQAVKKFRQEQYVQQQPYQILKESMQQGKIHKLGIPTKNAISFVEISDIIRCEATSSYTAIYIKSGKKILATKLLKFYENMLQPEGFTRVHDKHLINLNYVLRYIRGQGGQVELSNGDFIDVSKRRKKDLMDDLQQYFKM